MDIVLTLTDYTISASATAAVYASVPGGTVYTQAGTISGNNITIDYIRGAGKLVHVCANRPQSDQVVKDAVDIGCDIIAVNHPIPESCL